jgi:hypothetical protein
VWSATLVHEDRLGQMRRPGKWEAVLAAAGSGALVPVEVRETGLGQFRLDAVLPDEQGASGAGTWTLRMNEAQEGRLAVRHHQPSYPMEYRLNRQADPALANLQEPDWGSPTGGLVEVTSPQPLRPVLWLAALGMLLLSGLLRRV